MPEEGFRIERGMPVIDENGNPVGNLENIFSENETGASRFINVNGHLLPVETIKDVEEGRVKLSVTHEKARSFPSNGPDHMPSRQDQERAYNLLGLPGPAVERP